MKKVFALVLLASIVATSLVTGTLAVYTVQAPQLSGGDITAKQFAFTAAGKENFSANVDIAPTESWETAFTVANFEGDVVSQTNMTVSIVVEVAGGIEPLEIRVTGPEGEVSEIDNRGGKSTVTLSIPAGEKDIRTFYIMVYWPSTENDIDFMDKTSKIFVNATATQAP